MNKKMLLSVVFLFSLYGAPAIAFSEKNIKETKTKVQQKDNPTQKQPGCLSGIVKTFKNFSKLCEDYWSNNNMAIKTPPRTCR